MRPKAAKKARRILNRQANARSHPKNQTPRTHPAIGVLCLIIFSVLASLLLLRFWEMDDPMKRTGMQNGFLANVGVLGGLLLLLQNVM